MSLAPPIEVSVIVPVYRSQNTLRELWTRLEATLSARYAADAWEVVFVDDESPDDSWQVLEQLAAAAPQARIIQLMRNFGQHNALMCGFHHADGRVLVTIDDDLQHEPECVPRLVDTLLEDGHDLVYGVYEVKRHAGGRNLGSALVNGFYRVVFRMPVSVTSFRAVRRELIEAVVRYDLNFTYIDGLLAWNTRRIGMVEVPHHARAGGRSGYSLSKLVGLAMNVFTNFSLLPLQAVSILGLLAAAVGLSLGVWYLLWALLSEIAVPGYASIIVAVLVLGGIQLLSLGIVGEYLGRLHLNVNRKPQFTVRTGPTRRG
ncbi:glycosyltransferase family 2 protein [Phycisphaera mikurensis]|uniref:Glycosyltransferase n=1 Tax=Phycisphaera mikurensis (strain NBRC 102666 / KCTC 22515 / FYK2301M01) TaxID=1142394 RepID=I0IBF2_PHYMF|nr:glycosyltransferase family 2 protein [Phycisphaera mikurensis]MBB6442877.1 undecaprenyl-phosphate 4-deoxy-4-formamido-L-arabinose transferase [Phycisphaera mikurensis]BAM02590.1 glycosyltransferase [Phycisphaera mikurensis NBRC 102666]